MGKALWLKLAGWDNGLNMHDPSLSYHFLNATRCYAWLKIDAIGYSRVPVWWLSFFNFELPHCHRPHWYVHFFNSLCFIAVATRTLLCRNTTPPTQSLTDLIITWWQVRWRWGRQRLREWGRMISWGACRVGRCSRGRCRCRCHNIGLGMRDRLRQGRRGSRGGCRSSSWGSLIGRGRRWGVGRGWDGSRGRVVHG